jgi:hypothetical protein
MLGSEVRVKVKVRVSTSSNPLPLLLSLDSLDECPTLYINPLQIHQCKWIALPRYLLMLSDDGRYRAKVWLGLGLRSGRYG